MPTGGALLDSAHLQPEHVFFSIFVYILGISGRRLLLYVPMYVQTTVSGSLDNEENM